VSANDTDPVMKQLREQISDVDRSLIEAINRRLKLVAQLKRYKDDQGIAFVDPEREEWMFAYQSRANRGPLSDEGLRAFYTELLALTKREVG
jgi:chorismate mutase / prephenate dehydratase